MGKPDGVVAVPDIEVEGDTPHDDQPHVDLQQLPANCAASAPEGIGVLHHHHLPANYFPLDFKLINSALFVLAISQIQVLQISRCTF